MTISNYLLLKVSVLEHVSSNQACRIAEDFLTIICDPPVASSLPGVTPTPTPTRSSVVYNSSLSVAGSSAIINTVSRDGLTLTGYGGSTLSYNTKSGSFTMGSMTIRIGSPTNFSEACRIVFIDSYLNDTFRIQLNNSVYNLVFTNGPVYI